MSAPNPPAEDDWETPCPARDDKTHCVHWYDGGPCCSCGDPAATTTTQETLSMTLDTAAARERLAQAEKNWRAGLYAGQSALTPLQQIHADCSEALTLADETGATGRVGELEEELAQANERADLASADAEQAQADLKAAEAGATEQGEALHKELEQVRGDLERAREDLRAASDPGGGGSMEDTGGDEPGETLEGTSSGASAGEASGPPGGDTAGS